MTGYTPLRYPGGKAKLFNYISGLIIANFEHAPVYIEPFAGGAGLALKLLMTNKVTEIYINDYDPAIWALWESILNHPIEMINRIEHAELSITEWQRQKQIYLNQDLTDLVGLGFATLYLNRANRSGIILANPIGGLKQNGNYLIGCRFNKEVLKKQIMKIHENRNRIHLSNEDAKTFIARVDREIQNALIYLDPPYVQKGYQLYKNSFKEADHNALRDAVAELANRWIVTYDDCPMVEELYGSYRQLKFNLNYSVQTIRKGTEIAIYSNDLQSIPDFE